MAISIQVAQTPMELDDVFRLRYHVYVVEDNKFDSAALTDGRIFDRFDAYPVYNVNLIAYDGDLPVGTIRFTEDSELGLPQEELVDISAIRNNRRYPGKLFGIGMLAVRESYRYRMGFLTSLLKYLIALLRYRDGTEAVISINHVIEKMMARLGFERIGEKFYSEKIRNYIVPMYGTMEGVAADFREDRLAHELSRFTDSLRRKIFNKGDTICRQGEKGEEAYVLLRGSVNVLVEKGSRKERVATLGPGALIGEMSLVDEQSRSATLEANARETELMILSQDGFRNALYDKDTLVGILRMATERLRRMNLMAFEERRSDTARELVKLFLEFKRINKIFQADKDQACLLTLESAAEELGANVDEIRPCWDQLIKDKVLKARNGQITAINENAFRKAFQDSD
ncbi:MAG: cyclic nucleotide-binding domain-containing protein [Pseudomonadota bacterium]